MVTGIEIVIDDLGSQVAVKAVEVANWKARALIAEESLREMVEAQAVDLVDAEGLQLVEDSDDDDAEDNE